MARINCILNEISVSYLEILNRVDGQFVSFVHFDTPDTLRIITQGGNNFTFHISLPTVQTLYWDYFIALFSLNNEFSTFLCNFMPASAPFEGIIDIIYQFLIPNH